MAEIHVAQLGVAVEPEGFDHKGVELPNQEIGQVKRRELGFCTIREQTVSFKERITMGPLDHLNP